MMLGRKRAIVSLSLVCAFFLGGSKAIGATIVQIDGANTINYLTTETATGGEFLVQWWTSTTAFSDVSISAALNGPQGSTADVYLMTAIGPAATVGDQVATTTINLEPTTALVPIFSGLDLPAGTYYLVVGGPGPGGAWRFTSNTNIAAGVTTTYGGGFFCLNSNCDTTFAPASTWGPYVDTVNSGRMLVEGSPVPEPATLLLLGTGLGAAAARRRLRRKRA